jgi:hypothetical protein
LEGATLENLVPHGEAGLIPVNAFDAITAPISKYEQAAGERIQVHGTTNDAA